MAEDNVALIAELRADITPTSDDGPLAIVLSVSYGTATVEHIIAALERAEMRDAAAREAVRAYHAGWDSADDDNIWDSADYAAFAEAMIKLDKALGDEASDGR